MRVSRALARSVVLAVGLVALAALAVPVPTTSTSAYEPFVTPERPAAYAVDGTPQRGLDPAIAAGGDVYLAVWRPSTGGVRATRIGRDGKVLDAPGIYLTRHETGGRSPAVAFDGVNFLVVWLGTDTVRAKRVTPDGAVLDETSIQVSAPSPNLRHPAVAFDGTNYLVIWTGTEDRNEDPNGDRGDVHGTLLRPDGTVAGAIDIRISDAPGRKEHTALAFNGSHYLVVWDGHPVAPSNVRGTLVTTSAVALTPAGFDISAATTGQSDPTVAAVGTSFFVAWSDVRGTPAVYGTRVDATGTVVDPAGIPITADGDRPGSASDGRTVLVAYRSPGGASGSRATRVDASGTVLDPEGVALPAPGHDPVLAFGGDHYFVAGGGPVPVRGTRVTPDGAVLDPAGVTVSMAANNQSSVDVSFDGTNSFTVWSDDRAGGDGPGLYGARVGPDGQILDGAGFRIAAAVDGNHPTGATAAFDGWNHLVVWGETEERAIRAARVSRSGIVLERFDIAVGADPDDVLRSPEVAFGGGRLLVVWSWSGHRGPDDAHELRGARVTMTGEVLDPEGLLISPLTSHESFDVAFGSSNFTVVWPDQRGGGTDVHATQVTTTGVVTRPGGRPISATGAWQLTPQIAWNGTSHLVVWTEWADFPDSRSSDIRGARIDDAGTVLDPAGIPISTAPDGQQDPTVASNGPFLVAWLDRRTGLVDSRAVFGTRVDPDGTVADAEGFLLVPAIGIHHGSGPRLTAALGDANFTVAYERLRIDDPYGSTRAALRRIAPK